MHRPIRALATFVLLALTALPARALTLADSTESEHWRLDNGLEVRTRHVPGTTGIAIALAFRAGSGYDPAGLEGLAELLAELEFTTAAGDVPERTREEMTSLRPLGWEARTTRELVRFTEIVTPAQLPGALQQFATRMASPVVTDASLKAAVARVRRDAGARYFGQPADVLYWRSDAIARGADDPALLRLASLPGLAKLNAKDASARLHTYYQPGNASLALAGNLAGVDVRAVVQALFGKLAAAPAMPDSVSSRLSGQRRATVWNGLDQAAGVVASAAPALRDSLHPGFFLGLLVTGAALNTNWGAPTGGLAARFQYSLLDDPELVRFYPPIPPATTDPEVLTGALDEQFAVIGGQIVSTMILGRVRNSVRWLVGGELPADLMGRVRRDPSGLGTLASGAATRALWHGDAFWADYLQRLDRLNLGHSNFYEWLADPGHQSVLLLQSAKAN
ncbi:MAG: insulinase family protein [Candidatus Eisenbacteria bacterium]